MDSRVRLAAEPARTATRSLVAKFPSVLLLWPPAYMQRKRKDGIAQRIHDELNPLVHLDSSGAFFVYLRSFDSDTPTTETWTLKTPDGKLMQTLHSSPDAALESLLQEDGPLIEVGGPKHSGLGQVKVAGTKWWKPAAALIIHSTANFLNPSHTKGLKKEAKSILEHEKLKKRTFLIMEPTHQTMLSAGYHQDRLAAEDRNKRWNRVIKIFKPHGIHLPVYDARGAIISLSAPGRKIAFTGMLRSQLCDLLDKSGVNRTKRSLWDLTPDELCPCGSGHAYADCHGRKVGAETSS
jgi:hypothetical protein